MNGEIQVISPAGVPQYSQSGNDAVMIPNYGTINMQVTLQNASMPYFGGNMYIPASIDREYYNLIVMGESEQFDRPYVKVFRERALTECMTGETVRKFGKLTEENLTRIKQMPALLMAENGQYGKANADQTVIYGFIPAVRVYDNYVKVYYCGYGLPIPQWRLNEMLDELQLMGNDRFNELNRTHWAIKRCDLIQELLEAGVQIPVFNVG